jgi:hypothetical protein
MSPCLHISISACLHVSTRYVCSVHVQVATSFCHLNVTYYSNVRMISLEIYVITYQTTRCPALWLLSRCPHSSGQFISLTFPVTVLVNIVFRLMKEQHSENCKLQRQIFELPLMKAPDI